MIYAISDIHGCFDAFEKRLAQISADLEKEGNRLMLPCYYETATQIFVHAGVNEEIPEEEMAYCIPGTPEYVMTGKFPPTIGQFYKDIIAGHVGVRTVAEYAGHMEGEDFQGIFYDGYSHYYIDGTVQSTGNLLCLAYDEEQGKYYELKNDGRLAPIRAKGAERSGMSGSVKDAVKPDSTEHR